MVDELNRALKIVANDFYFFDYSFFSFSDQDNFTRTTKNMGTKERDEELDQVSCFLCFMANNNGSLEAICGTIVFVGSIFCGNK